MIEITSIILLAILLLSWMVLERFGRTPIGIFVPMSILGTTFVLVTIGLIGLLVDISDRALEKKQYLTLIMDVSPSMWSEEESGTRYQQAQKKAREIAKDFFEDCKPYTTQCEISIIAYAGRAFEVGYGLNSLSQVQSVIEQVTPALMRADQDGYDGSNLGAAIILSEGLSELRGIAEDAYHTQIITDGSNNVGIPLDQIAQNTRITGEIHFIGNDGAVFRRDDIVVLDSTGSPVILPHQRDSYQELTKKMSITTDKDTQNISTALPAILMKESREYLYLTALFSVLFVILSMRYREIKSYNIQNTFQSILVFGTLALAMTLIIISSRPQISSDHHMIDDSKGEVFELQAGEESKELMRLIDFLKKQAVSPSLMELRYIDDAGYSQILFRGEAQSLSLKALTRILEIDGSMVKEVQTTPGSKPTTPLFGGNIMVFIFGIVLLLIPTPSLLRIGHTGVRPLSLFSRGASREQ